MDNDNRHTKKVVIKREMVSCSNDSVIVKKAELINWLKELEGLKRLIQPLLK